MSKLLLINVLLSSSPPIDTPPSFELIILNPLPLTTRRESLATNVVLIFPFCPFIISVLSSANTLPVKSPTSAASPSCPIAQFAPSYFKILSVVTPVVSTSASWSSVMFEIKLPSPTKSA